MENEPLLHQLTVGQLRHILEDAQENAVVVLHLPAGFKAHPDLSFFVNLEVKDAGSIIALSPVLCEVGKLSA